MSGPAVEIPVAKQPPVTGVRRAIKALGVMIFSSTFAVTLIVLLARWSPTAEIVSHFRALYGLGAAVAVVCFVLSRSWNWCVAALALAIWQSWAIASWYVPVAAAATEGPEITVLTSNVNADTHGYAALLDVIAKEKPDLIFVQELSPTWAKALEVIHDEYPHRIVTARIDYFGLGFYSRYPIENADSNDPVNSNVPISRGDVVIGIHRLHIVNVHLAPPEGRALTALRYKQFDWLTKYLEEYDEPVITAGDFNCTMWSPLYHDLMRRGRLSNARQGHGVLASWFPMAGGINLIPIDHILGGGVQFTSAHLGARIGSDHVPVVAKVRLLE